jgi:amidase
MDKRNAHLEPAARVALGESFVVETVNFRTPIIRTPEDANPETFREREETGPIHVEGIAAGDVLAIHVEDVRPEGHASGGWWEDPEVSSFLRIEGARVHFPGGLSAPLEMMIGDIYVMPAEPCPNPWDNGGNMDFKDVCAGNTLYLRAQRDGGALVLGDLHAAQGDGEVLGLGAECAGEVRLRVTRDEEFLPRRPMVLKESSFVAIASRPSFAEARDLAAKDAAEIFARLSGCTEGEAFLYCATVGDLRNGAVWAMGNESDVPPCVGLEVPLP